MLIFEKVRYKNFLSTGNYFNEINLNENVSTLIVGKNGGGKSTFLDAICFGLFGKAFRNINKNQLINSINEKGTVVEVEFSINNKNYMVRRGIKPNIFEIYVDGEFMNQSADARDFQKKLEKTILKMNIKSFTQIVILGSSSFTPFMKLSTQNRRDVIEDILDIDIFSIMNALLKDRYSDLKDELANNNYEIKNIENSIELKSEYLDKMLGSKNKKIESLMTENKESRKRIDNINKKIHSKNEEITSIKLENMQKILSNLREKQEIFSKMKTQKSRLERESDFFEKNDHCNTCHQDIDKSVSDSIIEKNTEKIAKIDEAFVTIEKMISEQEDLIQVENDKSGKINDIQSEISTLQQDIRFHEKNISKNEKEMNFLENNNENIEKEKSQLEELNTQLKKLNNKRLEDLERSELYNVCQMLLKDSGIKTRIIKQYLPVMNKYINNYLNSFDFFANFNLDENFSEVIKSRHRDEFSYDSFSEGEKQRIDLAILFTWREIARMKNSVNSNLLILDEVFDSSLDAEGTENFMKVMNTLEGKGFNTFVISHKTELLSDKFENQIKFEKVGDFSYKK
tara:strand:+ start:818 stop:2527 length:1710 start_codon:yes stop_codon:yes gene_type:complete